MKNETFTPERIKAEADAFFEWDGEDRSLVTTTSCLLFAQHIAGLMQARSAQPAPVVPEGMTAERAAYFMRRFKSEEKLLGPNEQAAIDYVLAALTAAPAQGRQVECQECERLRAELDKRTADRDARLSNNLQLRAELSALKAQQGTGTTSDKYRAELYDEVWQLARDMGYGNVTMALNDLAAFKALKAQQVGQEPVGYVCGHALHCMQNSRIGAEAISMVANPAGYQNTPLYTTPQPAPAQDVATVRKMARALSDRQADACNVDREDQWKLYSEDFVADVEAMLDAAHDKQSGGE